MAPYDWVVRGSEVNNIFDVTSGKTFHWNGKDWKKIISGYYGKISIKSKMIVLVGQSYYNDAEITIGIQE